MREWGTAEENNPLNILVLELFLETGLIGMEQHFKALETSQRVDMVYNRIKKTTRFKNAVTGPQNGKSNKKSEKARIEGNNYFVHNHNYQGALECYTRSIALAELGSSYLALAYGNRSAVLFERKYYKECIEDIERALSLDYPENLRQKLLIRKAKAENFKSQTKRIKYHDDLPVINCKNPKISCASASVKIHYTENYGRHIIATKNIEVGEVISVEDTFTHMVYPESQYVHCHQCLEICYNLIPCKNCSTSLYCSEECRSIEFNKYHKYECLFPISVLSPDLDIVRTALIGLEDSKKLENDSSEIYRSDSFREIITLVTNEKKREYLTLCMATIGISLAYHALKENPEFTSTYDSDEDDQNLKKFFYKAYLIYRVNPYDIKKYRFYENNLNENNETRVAYGVYAFSSLYNHSCVPNCRFFNYGSQIVIRAQDNIKKGEQVTISYGIEFKDHPKPIRQERLKRNYLFDCDCKACTLNWPTYHDLNPGKELPLLFVMKNFLNDYNDTESNKKLLEELLSEAKLLYNGWKKQEPSQNLLNVQCTLYGIYSYQANKDVVF